MTAVVLKFGGTSVADVERIRHVTQIIAGEKAAGHNVAVVVSAMAGHTNQLDAWAKEINPDSDGSEYDAVVSSGEQVTAGLLALSLQKEGLKARSWQGWQLGINTVSDHSNAAIKRIDAEQLQASLAAGDIAVITGFQGTTDDGRITTLGRGGSDTSAVAVAAAIQAERCDIYTDVDGIYTADPRLAKNAKRLDTISFEEMLELASLGAKVLHPRSVALAMKQKVKLRVVSSFTQGKGTMIVPEEDMLEKPIITGIAHAKDMAKVTLVGVTDKPGIAADIFSLLAEAKISVDMIVQNISSDGKSTDVTFTVQADVLPQAVKLFEEHKNRLTFETLLTDKELAKVSLVGLGMRNHAEIPQKLFRCLADNSINIQAISTSEIRISVLIEMAALDKAVAALHATFELDQ